MNVQHKWNEYLEIQVDELLASNIEKHQITDVTNETDIEVIAEIQVIKNIS